MTARNSSLYWPMRLLPARRRRAAFAVYAFCRAADDAADGDAPLADRRARLDGLRAEVARIYREPRTAAAACPLADAVAAFDLPQDAFIAILDGIATDLDGPVIAPDLAALEVYCAQVAGAVGRLLVRIFAEDRRPADDRFALALGEALQLTNILRDVTEDAALGRLYLPREVLAAAGVPADPATALACPRLPDACRLLAARAEERYDLAAGLLPLVGRRRLWAAVAMMAGYRRLLARLKVRGWGTAGERPRLSHWEGAWLTLRAACGLPMGRA